MNWGVFFVESQSMFDHWSIIIQKDLASSLVKSTPSSSEKLQDAFNVEISCQLGQEDHAQFIGPSYRQVPSMGPSSSL